MPFITALLALVLIAVSSPAPNPDLTGTWEATINGPVVRNSHRIMVITKSHGTYDVVIHSVDESEVPIVTKNVTVSGNDVTMKFDMMTDPWMDYHRVYHAKYNGTILQGTWGGPGLPNTIATTYHRVAHASWPIIEPKVTMVAVDTGVKDEVLDWGGTGRAVMLLAGLGNTGHDFFVIIPELIKHYHVYSMTRRGFGSSSKPDPTPKNYSADRLGDDVLSAMTVLKIEKPVLIGHSIAGEELSDIATRFPSKVSGLIYLDAAYGYALDTGLPNPDISATPPPGAPPMPPVGKAVIDGEQKFKAPIDVPVLAIYASPHTLPPGAPKDPEFDDYTVKQIAGFKRDLPNAQVVVIPNADHFVYISNKDEVLRYINTFIEGLPKQ